MKLKIIGITGNRKLPDDKTQFISEKLKGFLLPYQSGAILFTGLAEGVDQLAAKIAIDLNIPYRAVLPFSPEQFLQESILEGMDPKSRKAEEKADQFRQYLKKAEKVIILPTETSENPYQQLGRYLIEKSDVLVAVWDGVRHYRPGSTSDVLRMSVNQKKALIVYALNITSNQWDHW